LSATFEASTAFFDQEYSLPLPIGEVKALADGDPDGAGGHGPAYLVEGFVSVYDTKDLGGDVVLGGAFDASLAAMGAGGHRVSFLRQHNHAHVLGKTLGLTSDAHGLHGRFKISRTPLGEETYQLLKDGALDSFSIGYLADEAEYTADGTRLLKQVTLLEASVVALPMQPRALVTAVKAGPGGAAGLPFDALWQQLRDAFTTLSAGIDAAKALESRRTRDGRALTERHRTELSRTLAAAEATLGELRGLTQPPLEGEPPPDADSRKRAAEMDGLRLRLELARRRLTRAGVLERTAQ
jgi:hypothetical protein